MSQFIKKIQEQLFQEKEKAPRTEFAILMNTIGMIKFKSDLEGFSQGLIKFSGKSEFCGCYVYQNNEIKTEFLIIKQV